MPILTLCYFLHDYVFCIRYTHFNVKGEAYSDPVKRRRQDRLTEAKKNLSKAFVPSSGSKKP